jgi:uncharacterized protein YceH (UPF0502 family)
LAEFRKSRACFTTEHVAYGAAKVSTQGKAAGILPNVLPRNHALISSQINASEEPFVRPTLTTEEARVVGCLMEKSVLTPDQYPLTLNALTNACNQKSGRNPVTSFEKGRVQATARDLASKHLVRIEENFKSGVEKYLQRLCNTHLSDYRFDSAQFAVICVLLLRGPRTPGELRANSGRLHTFADNAAVVDTLNTLIDWEGDPLVVKLPRTPGRKDAEYMHLLCGPINLEAHASQARVATPAGSTERVTVSELLERVSKLEADVAELKERLGASAL